MLHKTLFVTPPWVKSAGRIAASVAMVAVLALALFCTWAYRKDFDLVSAKTGIPGWLVMLEIHLFALMGLHSAIALAMKRKAGIFLGIPFGGIGMLGSPGRLGGANGDEFARAYPILFGVATLILCFLFWAFFYHRRRGEAWTE